LLNLTSCMVKVFQKRRDLRFSCWVWNHQKKGSWFSYGETKLDKAVMRLSPWSKTIQNWLMSLKLKLKLE
jgi:hypothetical protein